jgi:hypothetical protein
MCTARGGGQAFLCPEGTRFNQRTLVCDHKFRVTCSDSSNFFHRNLIMHEESMRTKGSMRATKKAQLRNKGDYSDFKLNFVIIFETLILEDKILCNINRYFDLFQQQQVKFLGNVQDCNHQR